MGTDDSLAQRNCSCVEGEEKMPLENRRYNSILRPLVPFPLTIHIRVKFGGRRAHRGSDDFGIVVGERYSITLGNISRGSVVLPDLAEHQYDY